MTKVDIRPMRYEDIDAVQRIERQIFPSPWSRLTFEREIERSNFHYLIVAEIEGRVVGYGCFFHVLDEGHVTNIGVDPRQQRRGIGTQLMYSIVSHALKKGVRRLMLEVRPANKVAQQLYIKFGFYPTGMRKGYYTDTGEDALVYWTDDIRSEGYRLILGKIARQIENGAA